MADYEARQLSRDSVPFRHFVYFVSCSTAFYELLHKKYVTIHSVDKNCHSESHGEIASDFTVKLTEE